MLWHSEGQGRAIKCWDFRETHHRFYEKSLRCLGEFNFVYASPNPSKFGAARAFFTRTFDEPKSLDPRHLLGYFHLCLLWETNRTSLLSRFDRDFLRARDRQFQGEPFESAYKKWAVRRLSDAEIDSLVNAPFVKQPRSSHTCVLPREHNIFETFAGKESGTSGRRHCSADVPLLFRLLWGEPLR